MFSLLVLMGDATARSADSLTQHKDSLPRLKKMSEYLSLKLSLTDNLEAFVITSNNTKYDFRPNTRAATRLSFNYRFVSFSISAAPKFIPGNEDTHLKGRSRFRNYAFNLNFNHWAQGLSFTHTKGYYLENTSDFSANWRHGVDPYVQLPNLIYQAFQGQTAYKFNKNFSFNAISVQTERQLRSAGTFMPGLSYKYFFLADRTPENLTDSTQHSNNLEFLLSVPYYYTFVFRQKFYVSAGLVPGAGVMFTSVRNYGGTRGERASARSAIFKFDAGLGFGYNGERFFAGAQMQSSNIGYGSRSSNDVLVNARASYQLFFGYRFGAPKILKKLFDFAEKKQKYLLDKLK
ncbi:MAG: DUF4421 family protein [Flavitalea sp.]